MPIVGRKAEIVILDKMFRSPRAEFLALYGRRRVGKTFLIRQFASTKKKAIFFNVTGSKNGFLKEQLSHFAQKVGEVFYNNVALAVPRSWDEAFQLLTKAIEQQPKGVKIILFFDELPWMATRRSRLLESVDYYWNQHWSIDARIKLIICGSSASWIINKIVKNRGGLHNRITQKIRLEPFTLSETKQFLEAQHIKLKNPQIALIYMVTGGVPYYLTYITKGLSAMQIIEHLAFADKAPLLEEFDILFHSLFDNADDYIKLISIIAKRREGIGKYELLKALGKAKEGIVGVKMLEDLEEAGFIISFMPHYHKRQGIYYKLIDEYAFFYLKWILPLRKTLQKRSFDKGNWLAIQRSPEWHNWVGYAFESMCYKHISFIRKALSLAPDAIANAWRYVPRKDTKKVKSAGAQIDLLFDRVDDAITVCEIKYTDKPFVLTKEYLEVLTRKLKTFKEETRTSKELFLALISANGVKHNAYVDEYISKIVTLEDLFVE